MLIVQAVALTVAVWAGAGPAAAPDAKEQRIAAAYQQFEKQRHVEAAIEFEALWRDYKEARFLFNAFKPFEVGIPRRGWVGGDRGRLRRSGRSHGRGLEGERRFVTNGTNP